MDVIAGFAQPLTAERMAELESEKIGGAKCNVL